MSNKKDIQEMLVSMGFEPNYIQRAFKVYEKNYGFNYNVEVITEIIVRLQNKDKNKLNKKKEQQQSPNKGKIQTKANKASPAKPPPKPAKPPQHNASPKEAMKKDVNNANTNYRHNYSQSANTNPSHIGIKKRIPSNPLPSNQMTIAEAQPIQINSNNQASPPRISAKQQNVSHKQQKGRQSPPNKHDQGVRSRLKAKDVVLYQGQEAEIMRVMGDNQYEITFPLSTYIMQRKRAQVYGQQIQKKKPKAPPKPIPPPTATATATTTSTVIDNDNNGTVQDGDSSLETGAFVAHIVLSDARQLSIHDKVDHRDQVGRFVFATVSEKQGSNLKIHYDGWSRKWDVWSDFSVELHRFAYPGSISLRASHRFSQLKKGDYVDINPSQRHYGWKCGEIRRLDQKSGQVQVVYEYLDKNYLYWAHLDNVCEIAEFTSLSGVVHSTQIDLLETPKKKAQEKDSGKKKAQEKEKEKDKNKQVVMVDEMETFREIRARRFPKYADEEMNNPYGIGEWLEVEDTQTLQWITATVIDRENNWILVHFDGWPSKYDQKIHVIKHRRRLRPLGFELAETQEERDIREEMEAFLAEVEQLNWKLLQVDADGNCLYRCFAINIYADTTAHMRVRSACCQYQRENREFFSNFMIDFEARMREKEEEYEWGDHVDITALSELYNVRVRVFEYDIENRKLYMSFDLGEHEESVNLPLILLARHRKKHYNIIRDPSAVYKRPLKDAKHRNEAISLRDIRLNEDAKQEEHKEEEHKEEQKVKPGIDIKLSLSMMEFNHILDNRYDDESTLNCNELRAIFKALITEIHRKLIAQHQFELNQSILNRFWQQQFDEKYENNNNNNWCKKWLNSLKEKIPSGAFPINVCCKQFNQSIVASITDNLESIVASSRKRQSTIDVSRRQYQQQQPMDIDSEK